MARLDARFASQLFNASDARNVGFGAHVRHSPASYVWNTSGHDRIHVTGAGITVNAANRPAGGTATRVAIDLNADGDIDATISDISVPLTALVASPQSFWQTLLKGHDTIYAARNFGSVLFGDFLIVTGSLIGGRDSIVGGTGPGQNIYGDAEAVGERLDAGGRLAGELTGSRDTIVANNTTGNSLIIGDARNVESSSTLRSNGDILTGSAARGDTIIGDAERVFESMCRSGSDTINGRGGDDLLIGDVRNVQRFPGATSGPAASGAADLINGGAGDDTIIGDMMTVSNAGVGALSFASGGNDRLNGNDGDDTIYGDTIEGNDAWADGGFGRDQIDGGAGNDTIYGDAATFSSSFLPDDPANGFDVIHGGMGDDFIDGGLAADRLFGDAGMDTVIGGFGNDEMTGGADADVFRFLVGSRLDRVLDFQDDIDELQISSAYGYADAASVVATATVDGDDITLNLTAEDKITLVDFGTDPNVLLDDIVII
jgi:serralysin